MKSTTARKINNSIANAKGMYRDGRISQAQNCLRLLAKSHVNRKDGLGDFCGWLAAGIGGAKR